MDGWGWDSRELGFLCVWVSVCVCMCVCVCVSVCVHACVTAPSSVSDAPPLWPSWDSVPRASAPQPPHLDVAGAHTGTGPGPAPGFFSLRAAARPDPWRRAPLASPEQAALS